MEEKCCSSDIFMANGLRITKPRQAIMEQIITFGKPFSANDIFESLLQKDSYDLVTIYRFINLLNKKGIVRQITECEGKQYFEMACCHNPLHPHFVCSHCHKISCLNNLSVEDFIKISSYAPNVQTKEMKIVLGGICENCKNV